MVLKAAIFEEAEEPKKDCTVPVFLSDETLLSRKEKVLAKMEQEGLDKLIVYGDVEHAGNFSYLVGFFTRFEEALLILSQDGKMVLMLGNENLKKYSKARLECTAVHVSLFSLPNQPNRNDKSFEELLEEAGICAGDRVGLVGWKNFTSLSDHTDSMYDLPSYIVDALKGVLKDDTLLTNQTKLFIGEGGVRTTNNANEIAHYEYGAALASDGMLDAMNLLDIDVTEMELGDKLRRYGQHTNVVTIASAGERFVKANMFPTDRRVEIGDAISLTVGYAGGSSSRSGYAVCKREELPESARGYMEELAIPYFLAYVSWLENIRIGMRGCELFDIVEQVLPRKDYHWYLCPGHLTAEEEWMSSPIYEGSVEELKSGMIFQVDIIPSKEGMAGVSAESTVVLVDQELKDQIRTQYPELWERMEKRREYLKNVLNIVLSDDLLPMCSTVGYLRPYLLNKRFALKVKKSTGNEKSLD